MTVNFLRVARSSAAKRRSRTSPDLSELEQLEAESFDLGEDAEQRGLIFEPTGEHGLAAHHLT